MPIEYVNGDLFEVAGIFDVDVIAHGCNDQGVMNSGVARDIRKLYPDAYTVYYEDSHELGTYTVYQSIMYAIVNLVTQHGYGYDGGRYVNYDAIGVSLYNYLNDNRDVKKVAIPKIGAGLGGGNWDIIESMIAGVLKLLGDDVTVYVAIKRG